MFLVAAMAALRDVAQDERRIDFGSAQSRGRNWQSHELRPEGIRCRAARSSQNEPSSRLYGSARVITTTYSHRAEAVATGVQIVVGSSNVPDPNVPDPKWIDCLQERGTVRTDALSEQAINLYVVGTPREDAELSLAGIAAKRWSSPRQGPVGWVTGGFRCDATHALLHVRLNEGSPEECGARITVQHDGELRDLKVFMDAMCDLALRQALLLGLQDILRRLATGRIPHQVARTELLNLDDLYSSMPRAVVPTPVWSALAAAFSLESRWMRLTQRFLLMRTG